MTRSLFQTLSLATLTLSIACGTDDRSGYGTVEEHQFGMLELDGNGALVGELDFADDNGPKLYDLQRPSGPDGNPELFDLNPSRNGGDVDGDLDDIEDIRDGGDNGDLDDLEDEGDLDDEGDLEEDEPTGVTTTAPTVCTQGQGYWKNHPEAWADVELFLGDRAYTQEEALDLLHTPARGDASIILAYQLIAAELNLWAGVGGTDVERVVDAAHDLIGTLDDNSALPPGIRTSTDAGREATALADALDNWNHSACES